MRIPESLQDGIEFIVQLILAIHGILYGILSKSILSGEELNKCRRNQKINIIIDLQPITQWQKGKACLIGDAAHATTPNMGQGACQAFEDAYVIGKLLEQGKAVEEVFQHYEKLRIKKAHFVINTSWKIGKVAHYENNMAVWFRNLLMKTVPKSVNEKQLDEIFNMEYI
jgi:2-polyprenyl-6-methoxyphenol hydroxylase-like FAD-dependent oxidoreductase